MSSCRRHAQDRRHAVGLADKDGQSMSRSACAMWPSSSGYRQILATFGGEALLGHHLARRASSMSPTVSGRTHHRRKTRRRSSRPVGHSLGPSRSMISRWSEFALSSRSRVLPVRHPADFTTTARHIALEVAGSALRAITPMGAGCSGGRERLSPAPGRLDEAQRSPAAETDFRSSASR